MAYLLYGVSDYIFSNGCDPDAADVLFLRALYRICNPILLSIRIFNPPTLTLLQVFYCAAD